jgi:hypothetical protein
MAKAKAVKQWYDERLNSAGLSLVCLLAVYILGSRAIDTGSLIQYFLTFVLIVLAINRAIKAVKG